MGRSVSYATGARVVTFKHIDYTCDECEGAGCERCNEGLITDEDGFMFEQLVEDFCDHLRYLFPSVTSEDSWIGREDHVLAGNGLAQFGMSEYCGLVSYWIVAREPSGYGPDYTPLANRWIDSIADKFVAAFGELSKVGSMSNGEGVYRQIRAA